MDIIAYIIAALLIRTDSEILAKANFLENTLIRQHNTSHADLPSTYSLVNLYLTKNYDKISKKYQKLVLKQKWRTPIGLTTFRTTISFANGQIVVGSNGESLSSVNDKQDGVYLIDSKTGQIIRYIPNDVAGDSDINGVAIHNNSLFFGSDNNRVFHYDFNGIKLWSFTTDGDVEGAPSLTDITGDGVPDVVLATENGSVYALNGENGLLIWHFQSQMETAPEKYPYLASTAFMSSPTLFDINEDGIRDVLIGGRNAIFYALDGKTGSAIWKYHTYSGIHSSAMIANVKGNLSIIFAESYSRVHILDTDGQLQNYLSLEAPTGGIQGLFSSPIYTPFETIVIGSSWWGNEEDDGFWIIPLENNDSEIQASLLFVGENRVSATPLVADILDQKDPQIVIVTENGQLIVSNQQGDMLKMSLESGVEATPLIADIDEDGKNELLIAANDGYLYCYETNGSGSIYLGQFRVNNSNTGVLDDQ